MTTTNKPEAEIGKLDNRWQYFESDHAVLKACKAADLTVIKHGRCWHIYGNGVDIKASHLRSITKAELLPVQSPQAVRRSRHA